MVVYSHRLSRVCLVVACTTGICRHQVCHCCSAPSPSRLDRTKAVEWCRYLSKLLTKNAVDLDKGCRRPSNYNACKGSSRSRGCRVRLRHCHLMNSLESPVNRICNCECYRRPFTTESRVARDGGMCWCNTKRPQGEFALKTNAATLFTDGRHLEYIAIRYSMLKHKTLVYNAGSGLATAGHTNHNVIDLNAFYSIHVRRLKNVLSES